MLIAQCSFAQADTSYQAQHDMLYTSIYARLKKAEPTLEMNDRETSNLIFKELEKHRAKFNKSKAKRKEPIDFVRYALKQELK